MNRKGLLNQIYVVLIVIVVLVFIIGLFALGSIVLPILSGEGISAAREIQSSIALSGISELTNASQVATSATINTLGVFELMVYMFFLGLIIGFILIAYYIRTYPFLGFIWAGAMFLIVIMAMIMSNAYEQAKIGELSTFYTNWGTNDFLMSYLPHIISFIGIIGGIILFALVSREPEAEVSSL